VEGRTPSLPLPGSGRTVAHRGARHRRVGVAGAVALVAVCLTLAGCQGPVAPSGREGSSSTRTAGRGSAGNPVSIAVERVERSPKEALPVGRIWDRTRRPVLRLITCGGSFDQSTGHYRDNVVVYAGAAS
jgi:hypothetical protein